MAKLGGLPAELIDAICAGLRRRDLAAFIRTDRHLSRRCLRTLEGSPMLAEHVNIMLMCASVFLRALVSLMRVASGWQLEPLLQGFAKLHVSAYISPPPPLFACLVSSSDLHFPLLQMCDLPGSPTPPIVDFLEEHPHISSLVVSYPPSRTPQSDIEIPPTLRLPLLNKFNGPPSFAVMLLPHARVERPHILWPASSFTAESVQTVFAAAARAAVEVSVIRNTVPRYSTFIAAAAATHLPNIQVFTMVVNAPAVPDERVTFYASVTSALPALTALTTIRLHEFDSVRRFYDESRTTESFDAEAEEEFAIVRRWSAVCPTLVRVAVQLFYEWLCPTAAVGTNSVWVPSKVVPRATGVSRSRSMWWAKKVLTDETLPSTYLRYLREMIGTEAADDMDPRTALEEFKTRHDALHVVQ
ncbi:hypothetical protein MIND_01161600 [Mycena indigotica]|uniref:F-box domain-containing protein n=1 Tax=Mycena indigotica TaxID=2126181 RepID=A0A8H6VSR8_9AGAR|nr:uncharacterized protein MIND_01161600 [Mycena indigotica]KAF7292637.1 hypothetical protein MIND_01161600 [Mycena indigotica]